MLEKIAQDAFLDGALNSLNSLGLPRSIKEAALSLLIKESKQTKITNNMMLITIHVLKYICSLNFFVSLSSTAKSFSVYNAAKSLSFLFAFYYLSYFFSLFLVNLLDNYG